MPPAFGGGSIDIALSLCVNIAAGWKWASARALGSAFRSPDFQSRVARYPDSVIASPHVFEKVAVPGICGA